MLVVVLADGKRVAQESGERRQKLDLCQRHALGHGGLQLRGAHALFDHGQHRVGVAGQGAADQGHFLLGLIHQGQVDLAGFFHTCDLHANS